MNYGKKGTTRKKQQLNSKSTMVRKKFGVAFGKTFLILVLAVIVAGGCAAYGIMKGIIDSAPDIDDIDATPTGYLSTVLDNEGTQIATLVASGSNRVYVTLDEIPIDLQHAFVAIEDERFYTHNGIDLQGILRAGITGITSGEFSQGASTITQQLLKNNVFTGWTEEQTFTEKLERKIQEQYLAVQLEKKEDKDWILENYLNTINLGQNTLGVQSASMRYFNKDVSELTLSESAVIAGITQNPSKYNPVSHPEDNAKRRTKVLGNMLEQGYITQSEYDDAMEDDVYSRIQMVDAQTTGDEITSYFVDALTDQVIEDLMDIKGYSETQAYKALYQGGLTIYSTQDADIQTICDEETNNLDNYGSSPVKTSFSYRLTIENSDGTYSNYSEQTMLSHYRASNTKYTIDFDSEEEAQAAIDAYREEMLAQGGEVIGESVTFTLQPQVSMTIIDQSTGEVKAIVGGRGDKKASKTLNRATGTTRQPGSTFKILAAYAAALDSGDFTLASVQDDAPFTYSNQNQTSVNNYDHTYRGFTTLRDAIISSINIVAVKTLTDIGTTIGYEMVKDFGITTLVDGDNTQALALGGITDGVTNLELTGAYATIANGGTYIKPRFYTQILDHDGNVLIDNTPQQKEVIKESTAWLLTSAMEDVITSGTGTPANFGTDMAKAGKSGTTTSDRDALFAGYTPYYTCVVWGGYDDNAQLTYATYPKLLWKAVMGRIHENLETKTFTMPSDITAAAVCKKSGKLAIAGVCDADMRGSQIITEYFAQGTEPTEYCDHHLAATVCAESHMLATSSCPSQVTSVYIIGSQGGTADDLYALPITSLTACTLHPGAQITATPDLTSLYSTTSSAAADAFENYYKRNGASLSDDATLGE